MNYNYDNFSSSKYALRENAGPSQGQKSPNGTVFTLDGGETTLLDFEGDFLVLEIGSISCPLFQTRRKTMQSIADAFPNAAHVILYAREAHPGQLVPAHTSTPEKIACAKNLRSEFQERRTILVDDFNGELHAEFGGNPNSVFVINRNGCVLYRSTWNNPDHLWKALKRLNKGEPVESEGAFFPANPRMLVKTLKFAGKGATYDFLKSLPHLFFENMIRRNLLRLFRRDVSGFTLSTTC